MHPEIKTKAIKLTPTAVEAVQERFLDSGLEQPYLRLGVKGGSCQGFSYHIEIANDSLRDKDLFLMVGGIKVVVDQKSMKLIKGTTLDFKSNMMGSHFKFDNPNAVSTCGCDLSFNTK